MKSNSRQVAGRGKKMLKVEINTSESIISKIYDEEGLGQNVIGKVFKLPLSYRLTDNSAMQRIPVWVTNFSTFKCNLHYAMPDRGNDKFASVSGQVEVFTGVADIYIDYFLVRSLKEPKKYTKFPVKGSQQLPVNLILAMAS